MIRTRHARSGKGRRLDSFQNANVRHGKPARRAKAFILGAAAIAGLAQSGFAATATWNAIPSDSFWNTANRTTGANTAYTPVANDALVFDASTITALNNNFTGVPFNSFTFNT